MAVALIITREVGKQPTIAELRGMTQAHLEACHDQLAHGLPVHNTYYLEELARRQSARREGNLERLTTNVERLTWVIAVLTVLNLAATVGAVVAALRH